MTTTYVELMSRGAGYHTERTALVFEDRRLTFRAVHELSNQLAHALIDADAQRGEHAALLLSNSLYSVPADFACVKSGINRVLLNPRLSLNEHARMLEETGCERLIHGADLTERAQALQA